MDQFPNAGEVLDEVFLFCVDGKAKQESSNDLERDAASWCGCCGKHRRRTSTREIPATADRITRCNECARVLTKQLDGMWERRLLELCERIRPLGDVAGRQHGDEFSNMDVAEWLHGGPAFEWPGRTELES
jgi:hypothetical protein